MAKDEKPDTDDVNDASARSESEPPSDKPSADAPEEHAAESESDEAAAAADEPAEEESSEAPPSKPPKSERPAAHAAAGGEVVAGHGEAALAGGEHHGLGHVVPVKLLFAVWFALMCLTVLTTEAARIDFGGQTNLVVAMLIATTKASLVIVFFMHLRWDRRFHAMIFLSGLLFVILFIGLALTDRSEYQPFVRAYEQSQHLPPGSMPRLGPQP